MRASNAASGSSRLWACATRTSYVQAFPFDTLVEGMLRPEMILETVNLIWQAVNQSVMVHVIINNRAGGNAPLLAQMIAEKFLERLTPAPKPERQLTFW